MKALEEIPKRWETGDGNSQILFEYRPYLDLKYVVSSRDQQC